MNDSIINSAFHLKYLGGIIDSKLNWIPHTGYYICLKFLKELELCLRREII